MSKPWLPPFSTLVRQFFTPIIAVVSGTVVTFSLLITVSLATGWTAQHMFDVSHPVQLAVAVVCIGGGILATFGVGYAFHRLFRSVWPELPDDDHA
jgi:hypothetical protein